EARLAHTGGAGERRDLTVQDGAQLVDPDAGGGARLDNRVAGRAVGIEDATQFPRWVEVDLVDTDRRRPPARLGDDEEAVEHTRVRLGLGHGKHGDYLVRVGQDDLSDLPGAASAPREGPQPRRDRFDHPLTRSGQRDLDPIPNRHRVGLAARTLEHTADGAAHDALGCADIVVLAVAADDDVWRSGIRVLLERCLGDRIRLHRLQRDRYGLPAAVRGPGVPGHRCQSSTVYRDGSKR